MRLVPLAPAHADALRAAAGDGRLWELWYTSVPEPQRVDEYIALERPWDSAACEPESSTSGVGSAPSAA